MVSYQLPRDGSVLIIDDKVEEALPIIQLLSKKGIASTYYSAKNDRELPEVPIQKVRLAFVDIQLFQASNATTYAQNILRLLDRTIPDDNGPYILIVWSILEDVYSPELEAQVMSNSFAKRPVVFILLHKADYFESIPDESLNDSLEEVYSSFVGRIEEYDLNAIKSAIREIVITPVRNVKQNALELISNVLQAKLKEADTFHLFTIWENIINKASGKIVNTFSTLYPSDKYWRDNLRSCIYRLAYAQLGKTIDKVSLNELIKNALKTLNYSFLDVIESEMSGIMGLSKIIKVNKNTISFTEKINSKEYKIKWKLSDDKYFLYINGILTPQESKGVYGKDIKKLSNSGKDTVEKTNIKQVISHYESITPEINNRLLTDLDVRRSIQPGNVYIKKVRKVSRQKELLKNYFKNGSRLIDEHGTYIGTEDELKNIIFIELEVTPLCDYTQGKWLKSRILPGILIPEANIIDIKTSESYYFYTQIPLLKINGSFYKPIFDFRLLKSADIDKSKSKLKRPVFRLRRELCTDILSRLSSHASRVGITYVE